MVSPLHLVTTRSLYCFKSQQCGMECV